MTKTKFADLARLPYNSWETHYLYHVMRMRKFAKANVDTRPPSLPAWNYYQPEKLVADYDQEMIWKSCNTYLLHRIIKMQNTQGRLDCFNTRYKLKSKVDEMKRRLTQLEKENFRMGRDIMNARSKIYTRSMPDSASRVRHKRHKKLVHVPKGVFKYFSKVVRPNIQPLLNKLLRPRIFFDLAVKNTHSLGRIVVQLFTEACPELVLEMMRMATHRTVDIFHLIRIFPDLWIEGEVVVSNEILEKGHFFHCEEVLDHGWGAGVLSFPRANLEGFPRNVINFSISLKPLPILNEKRIAFGVVTSGLRTLQCMQDYGTRNGKTKKKIVCVDLGVIKN